jgi:hypothetical protein
MATEAKTTTHGGAVEAHVGDWLEAHGIHGGAARRGEVVEILGAPGHEHYRVRWDETHESIVFPADGVTVIPRKEARPARAR